MEGKKESELLLSPGQELHRLLIVLSQDFYRPSPLLSIFTKLFPGAYFDPHTFPNRVHHVIARFRQWTKTYSVPLGLHENAGNYRLNFRGSFSIRIPKSPLPLVPKELGLIQLRRFLGTRGDFTTPEAARVSGASVATLRRLLGEGVKAGLITREGHTCGARYRWIRVD